MKRRFIPAALLAIPILVALGYFYGGSRTPAGQPPLRSLTAQSAGEVRDLFNAGKDDVRVLLLLSPT